jgi:hypothetical protein
MNVREQQLREADVRRDAPDLNPSSFLKSCIFDQISLKLLLYLLSSS